MKNLKRLVASTICGYGSQYIELNFSGCKGCPSFSRFKCKRIETVMRSVKDNAVIKESKLGNKVSSKTYKIITYRKEHPEESYTGIGIVFGISKQRVSQILNSYNKSTLVLEDKPITLTCYECGEKFTRLESEILKRKQKNLKHSFCGKTCAGKCLAREHGYPKGNWPSTKKIDWDKVVEMYKTMTATEIADKLSIDSSSVGRICRSVGFSKKKWLEYKIRVKGK